MSQDPEQRLTTCSEGIYVLCGDVNLILVHPYQSGDWGLEDIHESFGLGQLQLLENEVTRLAMTREELHRLEVLIHAQSFDFDQDFVELCLAMCSHTGGGAPQSITFFANF
jgi:hypothetical protein